MIPTGTGSILLWKLISGHSLPSANSRRAVVSFWSKNAQSIQAFKRALLFLLILLFPTIILCSYFFLLFSKNALLSLLFSPKMFEATKNSNFFLHLLGVGKNQIIAAMLQNFIKYSYFSCNSFFGTIFWYFLSMVMQCYCSENTLFAYYIFF